MPASYSLRLICILALAAAEPAPAPARVPKIYNALITSNQNLEPSKAYPVYQPVLHDPFGYPYPAVFYGGDYALTNGLIPPGVAARRPPQQPAQQPQPPQAPQPPQQAPAESQPEPKPGPDAAGAPKPSSTDVDGTKQNPAPPQPPTTQSPIPLNEFGLPAQVVPLGRFDPAYEGFTQVGPFTYSYPSFRFYDPYDPFSLTAYGNLPPFYRPLPNVLGGPVGPPQAVDSNKDLPAAAASPGPDPSGSGQTASSQSPPPEPNDLNVLNYASKDPAIPNVPPPPLPQGGLKSDGTE